MTRIVLVDDEPDILDMTAELLRMKGYEVAPVRYAGDILAELRRKKTDLLLQDVGMPDLDVDRLIAEIQGDAQLQGVKILLFTGAANAQGLVQRTGVQGVIEKPFDADTLMKKVAANLPATQKPAPRTQHS